ncbi:uncharacterized protein TRIVIDRAFT_212394 [Trichoderma virens Gv29-8]|uniref:Uncharacterized protein n=1 Tax=Hypocrea virens (strain Gv29-8 / FGSC 10586) TaxID=413071 RepID=G9ML66_HYPVG|nr:uncharacterized protein TRIVIDRAFT_212394 [Trichoderma virens Gv29-8]EHK24960.1 hypothetical protein TRIVIDRAFT_212394 [Trichoderma virens Gv29-8]
MSSSLALKTRMKNALSRYKDTVWGQLLRSAISGQAMQSTRDCGIEYRSSGQIATFDSCSKEEVTERVWKGD